MQLFGIRRRRRRCHFTGNEITASQRELRLMHAKARFGMQSFVFVEFEVCDDGKRKYETLAKWPNTHSLSGASLRYSALTSN